MSRKIITQIGSLPYDNPTKAVAYSLRHDIPFLPELPSLGDAMLTYIQNPGKLSCLKEFKSHKYEIAKVQCIGPATLILSKYKSSNAVERCFKHISEILDGLDAKKIILFLDEPALGQAGFDFKELWAPLFSSFKVIPGVHTCGNMDWNKMFDSDIEILSFDASKFDITRYSKYNEYRAECKRIAWGINKIQDVKDFRDGDLLTLPCGIGTYEVGDCKIKLKMLQAASRIIQRKTGLPNS